jgi:fructose-bisphosphate aldolase class I
MDQKLTQLLTATAQHMVAPGKGILAADESITTIDKRFTPIGLENTQENRQAFRDMLLTTKGIGNYISGVILFDETIRQNALSEQSFVDVLKTEGVLPGIKVDQGLYDMPSSPTEKLTKGLEGLDSRLKEYAAMGATFCKWRAVITISPTTPTDENIVQNAKDLAEYAKICQQNGLVPMVEPEILMDGDHTRDDAAKAS